MPLSTCERRAQLALVRALVHREAVGGVLALGEGQHPGLRARAPGASAASPSGPWARRRRRRGAVAVGLGHHGVDHGGPGLVRRAAQRAARARRARPASRRRAHAEGIGQEGRGPARDHGDQGERAGELGQQRRAHRAAAAPHAGPSTMAASVPSKSRNSAPRAGAAASGRSSAGSAAPAASPSAAQGPAVVVVDVVARSAPMTTTTSIAGHPADRAAGGVSGSTWLGLTPMAVAMDAAACC